MSEPEQNRPKSNDDIDIQEWIDRVADDFEREWKDGPAPAIAPFLEGSDGQFRQALLCELLRIDLEHRFRIGEPSRLEDYLRDFPELSTANQGLPDDLIMFAKRLGQRQSRGSSFQEDLAKADLGSGTVLHSVKCPHCNQPVDVSIVVSDCTADCPMCAGAIEFDAETIVPGAKLKLPRTLGKFQLLELVGSGSFGIVFKARDSELSRIVAIKIPRIGLLQDGSDEKRFLQEARASSNLRHPNIVQLHDVGRDEGVPYLVSDFVNGRTLEEFVKEKPLSHRGCAEMVCTIAEALHHAHEHQVIHRDVKPSNVLIDDKGEVFVTDFGLARQLNDRVQMTIDGQVLGTPAYMSPEQAMGESSTVDARSDVFSLGVVLYELLTGERPFRGNVTMLLQQVVNDEPRPLRQLNDRIPRDLETICLKAMSKTASRRYNSAQLLAHDLRRFLHGEPITARPVGRIERTWRWCRRHTALASLATAFVLSMILGTVVSAWFALEATERANEERKAKDRESMARESETMAKEAAVAATEDAIIARDEARLEAEIAKRAAYTRELAKVDALVIKSPDTGLTRLLNAKHFPLERRQISWDLLHRACLRTHRLFPVLRSQWAKQISPGGKWVAVGDHHGMLEVWSTQTRTRLLRIQAHDKPINVVSISPKGDFVASGAGNTIKIWNVKGNVETLPRLPGHDRLVRAIEWTLDGTKIISGGDDAIRIWDTETRRELHSEASAEDQVYAIAVSPDGETFATGGLRGIGPAEKMPSGQIVHVNGRRCVVRMWNLDTREKMSEFQHRSVSGTPFDIVFSPDGKRLASTDRRNIMVWDLESREAVFDSDSSADCYWLAFSPDGRRLATSGDIVTVWNVDDEKAELVGKVGGSVQFSNDGQSLLFANHMVTRWDLRADWSGELVVKNSRPLEAVVCSPDGALIAFAGEDGVIRLHSSRTRELLCELKGHSAGIWYLEFSADGRRIVSTSIDGTARIWDVATQQLERTIDLEEETIFSVAISADGERIAVARAVGRLKPVIRIHDVSTGDLIQTLDGHKHPVVSMAFMQNGRHLLTGSGVRRHIVANVQVPQAHMRLWDLETGEHWKLGDPHRDTIHAIRFTSDERTMAASSSDGMISLWDVAPPMNEASPPTFELRKLLQGHSGAVRDIAFSKDGQTFASVGNGALIFWDLLIGEQKLYLGCGTARSIAMRPDGRQVATAGYDGEVRIWNGVESDQYATLIGGIDEVDTLVLSADRKTMISKGRGTVRAWGLESGVERWQVRGKRAVAISADGNRLAVAANGDVQILSADSGEKISTLAINDEVSELFFLDHSNQLLVAINKSLAIYDLNELCQISESDDVLSHSRAPVTISTDGSKIAWLGSENRVMIAPSDSLEDRIQLEHAGSVESLAFSPDGQTLAVGEGIVPDPRYNLRIGYLRFWSVAEGRLLRSCRLSSNDTSSLMYTPDGKSILVNGSLVDVNSFDTVWRFDGPTTVAAFSKDGQIAVTGGGRSAEIRLWNMPDASGKPN